MFERAPNGSLPTIDVALQIDAPLAHVLADRPLHEAVGENVQQKLAEVVGQLGIPGTVNLDIEPLEVTERAGSQWLGLRVNGATCRYPNEVLVSAWGYAAGRMADAESEEIRSLLQEAAHVQAEEQRRQVSEFLSLVCADIVSRQPAVLLGPTQVAAYAARLKEQFAREQPSPVLTDDVQLLRILGRVLGLRISISDTEKVAGVLKDSPEKSWEDTAENLVDALAPLEVELHVPETYVALLTARTDEASDLLTFVSEGMFTELGIAFPPLRLVPATGLEPNGFRFVINHLPTLPIVGLEPGEYLVNDTLEGLRLLGIEGRKAINPATTQAAAIVDRTSKEVLEAAGFTTWDQAGCCVLCLAEALRRNGACFVHRRSIEIQVEQLGRAFPALVEAARAEVSAEQITRVMRMLADEEVSVRNLRLILERLVDYRFRTSDPERYLILDERLSDPLRGRHADDLLSFVRSGLKRQISNKYARGTSMVAVYLVDPELEGTFDGSNMEAASDGERQEEKMITALADEVGHLPPTGQIPSILTVTGARAGLREAIKLRFPRMGVLAYQDLRPDMNIQPVARISSR